MSAAAPVSETCAAARPRPCRQSAAGLDSWPCPVSVDGGLVNSSVQRCWLSWNTN